MKKQLKWMITSAILATTFAGGVNSSSYAADETAVYTLNPITVTATRTEKADLDTPVNTQVITAKELKETGDSSVFNALSRVTGFNSMSWGGAVQDYAMSTSRATLRGFDKGTLVMVNGAPINLLNYNSSAGIPVDAVEKVEVVKGASSVLYGSEAMAGVVNIITKKPEGKAGGSAGITYGNYASDYHVGVNTDKASIFYRRQFIKDIDLTSRKDMYKKNSKTGAIEPIGPYGLDKGKNDNLFVTMQLNDKLNLNWNYYDQESNRVSYKDYALNRSTLYKISDTRNNINLVYDDKDSGLKSVLAYNKRRSYSDKYSYSTKKWDISERYNMYSWTSDTQKKWDFRNGKDSLIAGFTFSRESYGGANTTNKKIWQSAYRNNTSIYTSYSTEITPDFTMILGVRGENTKDFAKNDNVFLPQIQTLYKLNANTSWFINVGKAFQMPAINTYFTKPGGGFNNLKPQQGWTYETGVKWIDNKSSLKVSAYRIDFKDAFKWDKWTDADGDHNFLTNVGEFKNTGVEVDFTHQINDAWSYHAGVSFSNPKDNEGGKWQQVNAKLQYSAGITYDKEKWTANVSYVYLGDRQTSYYLHSDGSNFAIPSSMDLSANFQYRPNKNQSITLTLDNILDKTNSVNKYENLGLPFNCQLAYNFSF